MFTIQTAGDPISCGDTSGSVASLDVFIGGKGVVRVGDNSSGHEDYPPTPAISGSATVFVNGRPVVRQGDSYAPHSNTQNVVHASRTAIPTNLTVTAG
jgi:uncharacterized Zn-binding protein involved in type VI secretion